MKISHTHTSVRSASARVPTDLKFKDRTRVLFAAGATAALAVPGSETVPQLEGGGAVAAAQNAATTVPKAREGGIEGDAFASGRNRLYSCTTACPHHS